MSLRLESVGIRRGNRRLLAEIDLGFATGELTVVLGPNGAGKSTLLRVSSGELDPDDGRAWFDGRPLEDWGLEALARRRAVLPQLSGLEFPFSVREVVRLGRLPHGDAEAPSGQVAVERALRAFELLPLTDAAYPRLSGGERQRVHAARVFAQVDVASKDQAPWVLLDEPTSALDLVHQHRLMAEALRLTRAGGGAVVVLHDLNLAATYADRLVLLADGRIRGVGRAEEVLRPDLLGQVYGVEVEVLDLPGRSRPLVVVGTPPT